MSSFYKDLNYELTQHNQRMRMELCSYRNEMIKVKHDLMKQREANALLKNSLTAEFLKVSKSFNIIFRLLENTCNDSIDETINEINNSISKLDNTDYGASEINTTITPKKQDNIGVASTLAKDSIIVDNASLSNFSFEVENEDTIAETEIDINVSDSLELVGPNPTVPLDTIIDESGLDESAMSVIEEDTENSGNESSVHLHCNVGQVPKISTCNNSSIVEDIFNNSPTPPKHRSTTLTQESLTDRFTLNRTSLRECSVLLHPIKMESVLKQSPRSTYNNKSISVISTNEGKLIISTNEEKNSKENEENVEELLERKHKKIIKSPERRLPRRKAAPKVLTEQNNKSKMRRE